MGGFVCICVSCRVSFVCMLFPSCLKKALAVFGSIRALVIDNSVYE